MGGAAAFDGCPTRAAAPTRSRGLPSRPAEQAMEVLGVLADGGVTGVEKRLVPSYTMALATTTTTTMARPAWRTWRRIGPERPRRCASRRCGPASRAGREGAAHHGRHALREANVSS